MYANALNVIRTRQHVITASKLNSAVGLNSMYPCMRLYVCMVYKYIISCRVGGKAKYFVSQCSIAVLQCNVLIEKKKE